MPKALNFVFPASLNNSPSVLSLNTTNPDTFLFEDATFTVEYFDGSYEEMF